MSENQTTAQQVTSNMEKIAAAMSARLDAVVGELKNVQTKGLEQASSSLEKATRAVHDQLAFAEQMRGEWRKLILGATRSATELFTPKS
jgi:hypothetical protein